MFKITAEAFLISAILMPFVIPILRRLKFGQSIREIGPAWHNKKSGTPTMGGIVIILASVIPVIIFRVFDVSTLLFMLGAAGFGIIGFIDDYIKVVKKRNLGLRAWQKSALQLVVAVAFVFFGLSHGVLSTTIDFGALGKVDFSVFYIPFAILLMIGAVNSVNLTDGIDGLATSVTAVVMLFFVYITRGNAFCAALVGALMGFLIYNAHPAKVFMGDTGSLFLGGAVAAAGLLSGNPFILLIVGIVYVAETLSVIIQVTSFKLTGKRVFKMSPIHHHFEMCGWNEKKIVLVFTAVTLVAVVVTGVIW